MITAKVVFETDEAILPPALKLAKTPQELAQVYGAMADAAEGAADTQAAIAAMAQAVAALQSGPSATLLAQAVDGKDPTAWGIYPAVGQAHEAVFELSEGLDLREGTQLTFVLRQLHGGHCIGRPRLSVT